MRAHPSPLDPSGKRAGHARSATGLKPSLDPSSPLALYYQLEEILRTNIVRGRWKPDTPIPSENVLCRRYGVSRGTVRQAIGRLVAGGLLERRQGRGTFVARPKITRSLLRFYSFGRWVRTEGLESSTKVLAARIVPATEGIAHRLRLRPADRVYALKRLRLLEGEPVMLETSWLPVEAFPGLLDQDLSHPPLYDIIEQRYGLLIARAEESLEPTTVSKGEARLLKVQRGLPAFLIRRTTYAGGDRPIEYRESVVRGDRFRYHTEL